MAIPSKPTSLSIVYNPDYYANIVTITAGDSLHTGFRIYRDEGEPYGWEQVNEINTTDMVFTTYMGSESDSMKSWGVTAFNAEGESARLDSNPGAPPAHIENFSAVRTTNPGEVALSWSWSGDSKPVYLFAASEYEASTHYWYEKGSANAQDLSALIADIPRFETFIIRLYATNSTYQQTPLAECTLQPVSLENLPAPTAITASLSRLDRILINFEAASWEDSRDFQYRFTFQRGTNAPIILDRAWGVLTVESESIHRQLYDEVLGLSFENVAEWTCTIQGISSIGSGDISVPFTLMQEPPADLLSFAMDETAQISWVFSDWQNALPLEVETRIDGGPWVPTFITDESHTNDELYGDACIIGQDWSGGWIGRIHFHVPFDGEIHTVEARARVAESAGNWFYSESQQIKLRSVHYPELTLKTYQFKGANGIQNIPVPIITVQRPVYYDSYALIVKIDDGQEIHWRDLDFSTTYRNSIIPNNFAKTVGANYLDGKDHKIHILMDVIKDGKAIHRYDLGAETMVIPLASNLAPAPQQWTAKIILPNLNTSTEAVLHLETATRIVGNISAVISIDSVVIPSTEIWVNRYPEKTNARYQIAIPEADGQTHVVSCELTITSADTGQSTTQILPLVTFLREREKPARPQSITATLLRQANESIADQVRLEWNANTLVQLLTIINDKSRVLVYGDSTESTMLIENIVKFLESDGAFHPVRFAAKSYKAGTVGDAVISNPIMIQARQPSPDQIPVPVTLFSDFISNVALDIEYEQDAVEAIVRNGFNKIKSVVARGGSVTLEYFGEYAAIRKNGERIPKFSLHEAFTSGVLKGIVLP